MFYGITDLTGFIVGTIIIVLLPGPNSLYVMWIASRRGMAAGYRSAGGIVVGDTILMVLSVAGVASLLRSTPALFMGIKYLGAAYLTWMGLGLLRAAVQRWRNAAPAAAADADDVDPSATAATAAPADGDAHPFRTALAISLVNPKSILFFVSFFIQFVAPGYPHPELSFLILGLIVQVCSLLYLLALIVGGARLAAHFRQRRRMAATATGGVGGLFIGFGLKLALAGAL